MIVIVGGREAVMTMTNKADMSLKRLGALVLEETWGGQEHVIARTQGGKKA